MKIKFLFLWITVLCPLFLLADYWKDSSGYRSHIITVPLWENKLYAVNPQNGASYAIYYSIATTPRDQIYGGQAQLFLHIRWQKKKVRFPLFVEVWQGQKQVLQKKLPTVNYPVSIRKPSSYRIRFPFLRNVEYLFQITAPHGEFLPVSFTFIYPR